jgi:hypothetical protein
MLLTVMKTGIVNKLLGNSNFLEHFWQQIMCSPGNESCVETIGNYNLDI